MKGSTKRVTTEIMDNDNNYVNTNADIHGSSDITKKEERKSKSTTYPSKSSTIKVTNIDMKELSYIIKDPTYKSVQQYMPTLHPSKITFEIHNSSNQFANAIRRCLTNELELKYMTIHMEDIDIPHGTSIVKDIIIQRLESIPIEQNISESETFELSVCNTTDSIISVFTDSLKPNLHKKNKYFSEKISICSLNPGEYICMDNIQINTTTGKENGRVSLGCVGYEVINHDMNQSSMNSNPTSFRLSLKIHGQYDNPIVPLQKTVESLKKRLDRINDGLIKEKENKTEQSIYHVTEYNTFKLHISNEKYTIGPLLKRYIFLLDPTIKHIGVRIEHPIKNNMILDIQHADPKKICMDAIDRIKKDLDIFISFFHSKKSA